jgi:uncharacterized protein with NAD-binding domain and iron-sulfur cluster
MRIAIVGGGLSGLACALTILAVRNSCIDKYPS